MKTKKLFCFVILVFLFSNIAVSENKTGEVVFFDEEQLEDDTPTTLINLLNNAVSLIYSLFETIYNFISSLPEIITTILSSFLTIFDYVIWAILHAWVVIGLIEIGIIGISMGERDFMDVLSKLFSLHRVVYIDVFYSLFVLNFINVLVSGVGLLVRIVRTVKSLISPVGWLLGT